ncbi:MAG: hypothetical protein PHX08_07915 [Lachnospiraceae bacterium]|nr:hypothetical protein [Lachnospiraceae bacterium]
MLLASVLAHIALGAMLALIFILYYVNGDGKWKVFLEILIGTGGNIGGIFVLDNWLEIDDSVVRMYSIAGCMISFLLSTLILLVVFSFVIKDKDDKDIIRLRDIMLGQTSWINKYYDKRAKEIDTKLNIEVLEAREASVKKSEDAVKEKENYIQEEMEKISQMASKRLRFSLPENASVVLNKDYIEAMPSYIGNIVLCINNIISCTKMILEKADDEIDDITIKSYFVSLATYISNDIFGGNSSDVRIHFRIYAPEQNGYVKLVAIAGRDIVKKEMTIIPYDNDSMIKKSYECRRALIKSINIDHDYKSNNHSVWQDYMTYTFYDISYAGIPLLSFGISIKNTARYKKVLHFLNYFRIEDFLQKNIEEINERINIAQVFYGGSNNG